MSFRVPEAYRITTGPLASRKEIEGNNGAFQVPLHGRYLKVIACDGFPDSEWEHVSVSLPNRCPTWEELCSIKDLFWEPEDVVIQFHPKESEYVHTHPFCLHLWRWIPGELPRPHYALVGTLPGQSQEEAGKAYQEWKEAQYDPLRSGTPDDPQ